MIPPCAEALKEGGGWEGGRREEGAKKYDARKMAGKSGGPKTCPSFYHQSERTSSKQKLLTSAVRYSRIAALYTAAVAPTLP